MVTLDGNQAYFSSNKINKANGWDIYFFDLHEAVQPKEVVLVTGKLTKGFFASDEDAKIVLKNSATGKKTNLQVDEESGAFSAVVKKEDADAVVIKLDAKKAAFSAAPIRITPSALPRFEEVSTIDIVLDQHDMEKGETYPIPHILFESNSDRLDDHSEMLIAEFAEFLAKNRMLSVQIQGHTDNVGDAGANLDLSTRRAKRVIETLYGMGIEASRLSSKGYGESKPVATNDTEEGRAKNRRTVFVVTQL
jgi:outer membrane protein OmpA-like peptidoglycan-associated protein